jgi:hypothetical protein
MIVTAKPVRRKGPKSSPEIVVPRIVQHMPKGRAWAVKESEPDPDYRMAGRSRVSAEATLIRCKLAMFGLNPPYHAFCAEHNRSDRSAGRRTELGGSLYSDWLRD